jgi:hypothetical protein
VGRLPLQRLSLAVGVSYNSFYSFLIHSLVSLVSNSILELAWLFLKLGAIAFGGPAAHIAMMEEEVVRRRKWLEHESFWTYSERLT